MPTSDDEIDASYSMPEPPSGSGNSMSKAELRKTHKPIMEKRRRARINNCLNEIKKLILEAMNKDPARHSKLEKADILEMAVKHLQNVQRQQLAMAMASDPSVIRKFRSGFTDCASEIDKFISKTDNSDVGIRDRVSSHLQKCMSGLEQVSQFTSVPTVATIPLVAESGFFGTSSSAEAKTTMGDQNNNPRIHVPQGIQLIPSRLPTGELALLVPNSSNLSYFPASRTIQHRTSAFATVTPQSNEPPKILSPPLSPTDRSRESPKGFRPVQSHLPRPKPSYPGEDHQVPQVSSTVNATLDKHQFAAPMEVKTMKFPIHKPLLEKERKLVEHTSVIRKLSEPLCVITNYGERFKQAQRKEDSVFLEENVSRGVKRDYLEMHQGILTTASSHDLFLRPSKIIKTDHHSMASSSFVRPTGDLHCPPVKEERGDLAPQEELDEERFGPVPDNGEQRDMWRPW